MRPLVYINIAPRRLLTQDCHIYLNVIRGFVYSVCLSVVLIAYVFGLFLPDGYLFGKELVILLVDRIDVVVSFQSGVFFVV